MLTVCPLLLAPPSAACLASAAIYHAVDVQSPFEIRRFKAST